MYQAIGIKTKKVYAKGTKADCFRTLQKKHPYFVKDADHIHGKQTVNQVYPETMIIRRA